MFRFEGCQKMQIFFALAVPLIAAGAILYGLVVVGAQPVSWAPGVLAAAVAAALVVLNLLMKALPKHRWDWLIQALGYLYLGAVFLMYAPDLPAMVPAILVGLVAGSVHWRVTKED